MTAIKSTEIHHRDDFPLLCMMRNIQYVAEVGVDRGCYSETFLRRHWMCDHYYGIDPYTSYPERPYPREEAYLAAVSRYSKFGYAELIKLNSGEASAVLASLQESHPDTHRKLGFVYIDADHSYQAVIDNIGDWWLLLDHNGIIAGHDYDESHPGVIRAVDEFAATRGLQVYRTWSDGDGPCHSWYIYKNKNTHPFRRLQP